MAAYEPSGGSKGTESFTSGYTGRIVLLIAFCSLTSQLGWLVLPPLLPAIIDDLGITSARAGFALTLLTLFSAAARYPGGRFADQLSRKTVLVCCLIAWTVGFATLAATTTYPVFVAGVVFVGLGLGMYVPAASAQLTDLFERKQGRALGVNNAAFNLAGILAPGVAIGVLAFAPWRAAFLLVVGMLLVLFVLLHRWSREEYVFRRVDLDVGAAAARTLFDPRVRPMLVVAALIAFVWNGAVSFFPIFLESEQGLSAGAANVAFAALFLTGVVATPLSGGIGDRFGTLRTVLAAICFTLVGLVAIVASASVPGTFLGVILFAIGLTGFWPVMTSYMMTAFPEESKGGDYGVIGTGYMAIGSVGPTYVGTVSQYVGYTAAYAGFAGCLVVSLAIVLRIRVA